MRRWDGRRGANSPPPLCHLFLSCFFWRCWRHNTTNTELPAKLLDYFLRINKSNIYQHLDCVMAFFVEVGIFEQSFHGCGWQFNILHHRANWTSNYRLYVSPRLRVLPLATIHLFQSDRSSLLKRSTTPGWALATVSITLHPFTRRTASDWESWIISGHRSWRRPWPFGASRFGGAIWGSKPTNINDVARLWSSCVCPSFAAVLEVVHSFPDTKKECEIVSYMS